jgi:hypothetical protein
MIVDSRVDAVAVGGVRVRADPVGFWLGRLSLGNRRVRLHAFRSFVKWLNTQPGWERIDARGLLLRQVAASPNDVYAILDKLQEYVNGRPLAKATNKHAYTTVRSFFMHNRVPLPDDPSFKVAGVKPPVTPRLTVDHVVRVVKAATLRDASMILVKWQGLLDNEGVVWVGTHLAEHVTKELKSGVCPIRLDLPSRKNTENEQIFFTFIGRDSIEALRLYFEEQRGWPQKGEPIWLNRQGRAVTRPGFWEAWLRLIRRVALIPPKRGNVGSRYGFNPHEMRDVARSLLHIRAKADGFDADCAELWMGHTSRLDPLKYDKFYLDREYVLSQYRIAEKYLNIISNPPHAPTEEMKKRDDEIETLKEKMGKLEETMKLLASGEYGPARST